MLKHEKNMRNYANIAIEKYSNYINAQLELITEGDDYKKETVIRIQKARDEWDYAATTFYGMALKLGSGPVTKETIKKPSKKTSS